MKGTTKSGFEFKLTKERLENYELIEALSQVDANPLILPTVVNLLLGVPQANKLKDHLRDKDGLVSAEKLSAEIKEVFESQQNTKNS